jgi:hypothetical protein
MSSEILMYTFFIKLAELLIWIVLPLWTITFLLIIILIRGK